MARLGETAQTSLSLEAQRAVIEDWASANGFVVIPAIEDHDLKGDDPTRPGVLEIERQAQSGDTVAVYKFDRLARDIVLQETLVRSLQARNVQVISVTEPSTRLTRVIYGAVNEEFRDALSQRIKDARKQQALRGHYIGANTPYGYQRSQIRAIPLADGSEHLRPSGILAIEPTEAAVVRDIFERVASGESLYSIMCDLNLRGVPTRHRRQWLVTTIKQLVSNRWYYGAATYKGEEVGVGLHEPLVSRDDWERANLLLKRPPLRQKVRRSSSWLEGYVVHSCGRRMYLVSTWSGRNQRYHDNFYCQSVPHSQTCGEPRRQISKLKLDAAARQCLAHDLAHLESVEAALERAVMIAGGPETVERRAQLEEKRARILIRYERAREAWVAGIESIDWLATEQDKRDTAIADVDAEMNQIPVAPDRAQYELMGQQMRSLAMALPTLEDAELTSVLAELGTLVVRGDGVCLRYDQALTDFVPRPFVAVVS